MIFDALTVVNWLAQWSRDSKKFVNTIGKEKEQPSLSTCERFKHISRTNLLV